MTGRRKEEDLTRRHQDHWGKVVDDLHDGTKGRREEEEETSHEDTKAQRP